MTESTFSFHLASIEFTAHVHATEDFEKVKQAFLFLVPESLHDEVKLDVKEILGHWSNPIILLQAKFTDTDNVRQIINSLLDKLNDREKALLKGGLERRVDESHLYLRFDKQAAFKGAVHLKDEDDVIRLALKFIIYPSPTREKVKSICERLLMET